MFEMLKYYIENNYFVSFAKCPSYLILNLSSLEIIELKKFLWVPNLIWPLWLHPILVVLRIIVIQLFLIIKLPQLHVITIFFFSDFIFSSDSPVLWVRIDPEVTWLRQVTFEQPDYMWQYQLKHERDVIAQSEVLLMTLQFINWSCPG